MEASLPGRAPAALLALAVMLFMTGCSGRSEDYFPLDPGLSWHYRVSFDTMDGRKEKRYVVDALGPEQVGSRLVYPKRGLDGSLLLFERKESGIFRVGRQPRNRRDMIADDPPVTILPIPLNAESSWQARSATRALERTGPPQETLYRITTPVNLSYRVETLNDTVTVPAGTFKNCARVKGKGEVSADVGNYIGRTAITVDITDWYAPGVGLVKSVRKERTGAEALGYGASVMELQAFNRPSWF